MSLIYLLQTPLETTPWSTRLVIYQLVKLGTYVKYLNFDLIFIIWKNIYIEREKDRERERERKIEKERKRETKRKKKFKTLNVSVDQKIWASIVWKQATKASLWNTLPSS